jgi:amino acid adenylation domain-containing protein
MIGELIDKLIDLDINIEVVEQDKLRIHTDIKKIPGDVLSEIRLKKQDLVKYFSERSSSAGYEKIPVAALQEDYPLSYTQRRLWFLSQFEESNIAYNIPATYLFEGELDIAVLKQSLEMLIARHESLRTIFRENGSGEVRQFILQPAQSQINIGYNDLRVCDDSSEKVRSFIYNETTTAFDLCNGPLLRISVFQLDDNKWLFSYVMHHIISDGASMSILMKELLQLYSACINGKANPLSPLRIQYKDFASWQQQQAVGNGFALDKDWWLKQFSGPLPVLELGFTPRPAVKTYNGAITSRVFNKEISKQINALCRQEGGTVFMGLLSAVYVLLHKYTQAEDIVIGSPIAGRDHADLEGQIGFYVNTLALRAQFNGTYSYRQLFADVKRVTMGAYQHQSYPYDELVDELHIERDMSRNPLFDVMVALHNTDGANAPAADSRENAGQSQSGTMLSKFDLSFDFAERGDEIHASLVYNTDIVQTGAAVQLLKHLEQLLYAITEQPSTAVGKLEYLTEKEKDQLLVSFNNTAASYSSDKTIQQLFEEQVLKTPDQVALMFEESKFTFNELNQKANRLAHYLRSNYNIQPDDLVCVVLEKSEWMIISILAVLKAGGAYVPIDPAYPQDRIDYMVADSNCKAIIDRKEIEKFIATEYQYPSQNLESCCKPENLVYVIYTSGSTGKPKGCMLEHRGVVNRIEWMWHEYAYDATDVILQKTSFTFDVSVWEIFMPLCKGAAMVLCHRDDVTSPERILSLIQQRKVTCLHFVPGMLNAFIATVFQYEDVAERLSSLRKVITSGEALQPATVASWYEKVDIPVHNLYGPTEASVDVTYYATQKNDTIIPIGRPIWNTQMYVMDKDGQLVPPGVQGEICIGGIGLARGYLNRAELTAEKFVRNPFRKNERIYRTGDLGFWLPDGNIVYSGRKDNQVKIRGYRIELGEIESALQDHPLITSAVVLARQTTNAEKELVAYIITNGHLNVLDIRSYMGEMLPAYMVPAFFVQLNEFPLTSSGKIDRKALPQPEHAGMQTGVVYEAPANRMEEILVDTWQAVLGRENIGVHDDYFALGGSSLKAMMIVKKLMDATGLSLPVKLLFEQKNIRAITKHIDISKGAVPVIAYSIADDVVTDASYNQRTYFAEWNKGQGDYLVINTYEFAEIDAGSFETAVNKLVERHEILRTVFVTVDGTLKQQVLAAKDVHYKLPAAIEISSEDELVAIKENEHLRTFDLASFPLFYVQLLKRANGNCTVLVTKHHIITDGYSGGIIKDELTLLYTAALQKSATDLKPLQFQYRHFSGWQKAFVNSPEGEKQQQYWLNKLHGFDPRLKLPSSVNYRPGNLTGITTTVNGELYNETDSFAKSNGITRTVLFMGVLALLVNRLSARVDVTVFTTASGRNCRHYGALDVSGLIGYFANLLPVRNIINRDHTVLEYLQQVQDNFLDDLNCDAYPIDKLMNELPAIDQSGIMEASVFYNYHNYNYLVNTVHTTEENENEERRGGNITMKLALALGVTEFSNCLTIQLMFNENLFARNERLRIKKMYFSLLQQVISNPQQLIKTIK